MNNIQAVVFDMDDTLIPNVKYFDKVRSEITDILFKQFESLSYTSEQLYSLVLETDLSMTIKHGLSRNRFVASVIEVYYDLCHKHNLQLVKETIRELLFTANSVFDYVDKIGEVEKSFLNLLNIHGIPIYLLTSGDKVVQSYKIYNSNIYRYIPKKNTFIVDKKTPETYKEILNKHDLSKCVMIGNSKKSDINPSLLANMFAIHIEVDTWGYEDEELNQSEKLFTVKNFKDVEFIFTRINNTEPADFQI